MSLEQLITDYGYYVIALFSCIEGEAAVITAGIIASQGLLDIRYVCISAFIGTWVTEQTLFFVGRYYGRRIINRFQILKEKSKIAFRFVRKYDWIYIFSFRFIYGIRNISPLVIGSAMVSPKKYCFFNFLAAVIWASTIPLVGYYFADFIKSRISNVEHYVIILGLFVIAVALVPYLVYKFKDIVSKRKK